MEFHKGQRVYVEGDAVEICTAGYSVMIASMATVTEDTAPHDDYVRLSIDKVGGDRSAIVYVVKDKVRRQEHEDPGRCF